MNSAKFRARLVAHFRFDESKHPRGKDGKFGKGGGGAESESSKGGESEAAEKLEFTAPGKGGPSLAQKIKQKLGGAIKSAAGVLTNPKTAISATVAAVKSTMEVMEKPLTAAGYSKGTARAVAATAAVLAATPLSFGLLGSVIGVLPAAAAAIPGAVETAVLVGGAIGLKNPKKAYQMVKEKLAERKKTKETQDKSLKELREEKAKGGFGAKLIAAFRRARVDH